MIITSEYDRTEIRALDKQTKQKKIEIIYEQEHMYKTKKKKTKRIGTV